MFLPLPTPAPVCTIRTAKGLPGLLKEDSLTSKVAGTPYGTLPHTHTRRPQCPVAPLPAFPHYKKKRRRLVLFSFLGSHSNSPVCVQGRSARARVNTSLACGQRAGGVQAAGKRSIAQRKCFQPSAVKPLTVFAVEGALLQALQLQREARPQLLCGRG